MRQEEKMGKNRIGFIYNHLEEIILVAMFAVMVAVIFIQVIMRYVFNNSLSWSEELGRFMFEWLTWIGMSIGAKKGQHIKITMLVDKFPFRLAQAANILSEIIVIVICGLTMIYGVELARMFAGALFTSMKISLAWGYASVVVGCGLMIMRSIISAVRSIKALKDGELHEIAEGGGVA